jgi:hypothetical protein
LFVGLDGCLPKTSPCTPGFGICFASPMVQFRALPFGLKMSA